MEHIQSILIYYHSITHCECFLQQALADDLSLESEWQQVFLSLHDSSQYSG